MLQHQQTLGECSALCWAETLNYTQQRILKLIATGEHTQSQVAERVGVTRQYVNQLVRKLLDKGLLKRLGDAHWVVQYWRMSKNGVVKACRQICKTKDDALKFLERIAKHSVKTPEMDFQKCSSRYNIWYELEPHLMRQLEQATPDVQVSTCRVHHIRLKYSYKCIGNICTDYRTDFCSSWEMRGGTRYKFFVQGKGGKPDVTIDVHPKTIVAYPDAGQTVYAESIEESKTIITAAIHEAVLKFQQQQELFGTKIDIKNPSLVGKLISKAHAGFKFLKNTPFAQEQTKIEGCWIDSSPEKNGEKGYAEFETDDEEIAAPLDQSIMWLIKEGRNSRKSPFDSIREDVAQQLEKQNQVIRKNGQMIKEIISIVKSGT